MSISHRYIVYVAFFLVILSWGCKEVGNPDFNPPGGRFLTNWQKMQFVGNFNDWNLENAPLMELVDDWTWQVEQELNEGMIQFKFVPDGNWEVAYGDTHVVKPDSLEGHATPNASGLGQHIEVSIPSFGLWKVTFNEYTLHYSFELVEELVGGVIAGRVTFTDCTSPPYPSATVTLFDTSGVEIKSTSTDTMTGDFELSGISEGIYMLVASASGYIPDTAFDVQVHVGDTTYLELELEPSTGGIVLDGVIDPTEGWHLLDTSMVSNPNLTGANLQAFYAAYDEQNLYIALSTNNISNWELSYGFALDVREGGYENDSLDCWNRLVGFRGVGIDYEVYFWWNSGDASIGAAELCEFTNAGWQHNALQSEQYAYSGDMRSGLAVIEIAIPWDELGGMPQSGQVNLKCWIAGGNENSSAVDAIPYEPSIEDSQNEWTDVDMFEVTVPLSIH